jgi:hypothetical protein
MENKNFQLTDYDSRIYRFGRISTILFLLILICVPLSMSLIWGVEVDILTTAKAFITPFAMFLVVGTVEVFTLAPILGPGGTFLSFNNGNTTNMTMPATVNSLKVSGYTAGTREAEIVSLIGASTSVIVSKTIIFIGMLSISVILPILQTPVLQPAFENFMPALLGALAIPMFKKDWKTATVPAAIVAIVTIILGYSTIEGIEPLIMPLFLAIAVWWKYVQYKKAKAKKEQQTAV